MEKTLHWGYLEQLPNSWVPNRFRCSTCGTGFPWSSESQSASKAKRSLPLKQRASSRGWLCDQESRWPDPYTDHVSGFWALLTSSIAA